jgi:hypothetical protein
MLPHAYATVSRSQIDSDSRSFTLTGHDFESSENNTRSPLLQKTTKKKKTIRWQKRKAQSLQRSTKCPERRFREEKQKLPRERAAKMRPKAREESS